jgi:hypothetical protein
MEDHFEIFGDMELDIDGQGLYELGQGICQPISNDLHFLKLATKSKIHLFEGSGLNILTCTFMILMG